MLVKGHRSAIHLILRSLLPPDFSEDMFKEENPKAKANAMLLQIQMDRSATDRLIITTFSGSKVVGKDLKQAGGDSFRPFVTLFEVL